MSICSVCQEEKQITLGMGNYHLCRECASGSGHKLLDLICFLDMLLQVTELRIKMIDEKGFFGRLVNKNARAYLVRQAWAIKQELEEFRKVESYDVVYWGLAPNDAEEKYE